MTAGRGQKDLVDRVINKDLCTSCGACATHCPYFVSHRDRLVVLHSCDLADGKCYDSCPRTELEITRLQKALFPDTELTVELGPLRHYQIARLREPARRKHAQHGGLATGLMTLALTEGMIEAAVLAAKGEGLFPQALTVGTVEEIGRQGGSRFVVAPLLAEFHRRLREGTGPLGMVLLPCQLQALAKWRDHNQEDPGQVRKMAFTIGLFCGWSLRGRDFLALLKKINHHTNLLRMDIPRGKDLLELTYHNRVHNIPLTEIQDLIRPACRFCVDTTAEFSDISVGSAGLYQNGEKKGYWNQVIIRSARGEEIFRLAQKKGLLEVRADVADALEDLKAAAAAKKRRALENLMAKSGNGDDLLYLKRHDPALAALLSDYDGTKRFP